MNAFIERMVSKQFTLIAEIGVNYYDIAKQRGISTLDAAKLMCYEAKKAGVHAVKFQSYKAETLAAADSPSYWNRDEEPTQSQRELFRKFDSFGEAEYREIASYCDSIGIVFFSTAFDFESADYLNSMMCVYKVSSSDITNLPFIEYQAKKGKPIILSVGAANADEIKQAVDAIRNVNNAPLVLCHCVLEYPTPYRDANLRRIASLGEEFPDVILGYSDHCKPDECVDVLKTAYILGAHVIEKHFTLDKTLKGNDHYHAMNPDDARKIIKGIAFVESILGDPSLEYIDSEMPARINARRSIVSLSNIAAGEVIRKDALTYKRPGTGISPNKLHEVIGRIATVDIAEDTVVQWDMLS